MANILQDAVTGVKNYFTDQDPAGDWSKNPSLDLGKVATAIAAGAGLYGLAKPDSGIGQFINGETPQPVGYQGGVPDLTGIRSAVQQTYDPLRRPGSGGQRYFSDMQYALPGEEAAKQAVSTAQAEEFGLRNIGNPANQVRPPNRRSNVEIAGAYNSIMNNADMSPLQKGQQVQGAMDRYGVSPYMLSEATGVPLADIQKMIAANSKRPATASTTPSGFSEELQKLMNASSAPRDYSSIQSAIDAATAKTRAAQGAATPGTTTPGTPATPPPPGARTKLQRERRKGAATKNTTAAGATTDTATAARLAAMDPSMREYAAAQTPSALSPDVDTRAEFDAFINSTKGLATLADAQKYGMGQETVDSANSQGQFSAGEVSQLLAGAQEFGLSPADMAAKLGVSESDIVARLKQDYPSLASNYLTQYGYAKGGIATLNTGGMYLGGATDGMADKIPANIDGNQAAALSDGEFVLPADVVSHLGNGNSEAGAKVLYSMMERIRKARTGTTEQGKQINPGKMLPK